MPGDTKLEVGWVIGLTLIGVLLLTFGLLAWWTLRTLRREGYRWHAVPDGRLIGSGLTGILALIVVPVFVLTTWPTFNLDYHRWQYVAGTVATVETRLVEQTELYAVTLTETGDQVYRCDDTRCSVVKTGDRLGMWCIYQWQQASTPGMVCNFGDHRRGEVTTGG
jgi:hypothetical protein